MTRLQDVLAALSDDEAIAVYHALAQHVENEQCRDDQEVGMSGGLCGPIVERMDAVLSNLVEGS